jgi:hypothetical protein
LLCSVTRHHSLCLLFHLPRQCQRVTHTAVGCFLPLSHSWFCREWGFPQLWLGWEVELERGSRPMIWGHGGIQKVQIACRFFFFFFGVSGVWT